MLARVSLPAVAPRIAACDSVEPLARGPLDRRPGRGDRGPPTAGASTMR